MPVLKASELPGVNIIPFQIPELDRLLKGGISTKKVFEIFGPWSIGKSTLGYYLAASAQSLGMEVFWADTENSMTGTTDYPKSLGVDLDMLYVMNDNTGGKDVTLAEDYLDEMEKWAKNKKNSLIILDSVAGVLPRSEAEKNAGESAPAARARLLAVFARHIKPLLALNNNALVLLNHQYNPMNFGAPAANSKYPEIKAAGGERLDYHKDVSILLSETWVRQDDKLLSIKRADGTKGGRFIKAKVYKDKVQGTQWEEAIFALSVGKGIIENWNLLEDCISIGIITKEGNTYFFKGERICVGRPKLNEWAKEHAEELKEALNG